MIHGTYLKDYVNVTVKSVISDKVQNLNGHHNCYFFIILITTNIT